MVAGSASVGLARSLAKHLGADAFPAEVRSFADGELYVRVGEPVAGEEVVLVQTTYPNEMLLELFLLQDALSDADARSLTLVIPYFAYGRQDKRFKKGEAISSRAVARRVSLAADRVLTVEAHDERIMSYFDVPATHASGMPALARYFADQGVDLVLAPDENAASRAKAVGDRMKVPWDFLKKERIDSWTVETETKPLEVKGRHVAIVDDVISTGGTMASAAHIVKDQGAKRVVGGCVHGLFVKGALDRLKAFDDLVCTDTVTSDYSKVSVAPEVATALRGR